MSDLAITERPWRLPAAILYPQRGEKPQRWLDPIETFVKGVPNLAFPTIHRFRLARIVPQVNSYATRLRSLRDSDFIAQADYLREQLRYQGFAPRFVAHAFAVIREAAWRKIGQRHYDVQLVGGYALLNGVLAEMETGEGKTLTATLAAGTAALAGIPVHVVTVNDYLARRDAETMAPVYETLGLSVGMIVHGMSPEERRAAYASDITYCSNKEIAFDYLRDRIVLGKHTDNLRLKIEKLFGNQGRSGHLVMRGLHFAIVDEVDSVLVDEARTPLIISKETDPVDERTWAEQAFELAGKLQQREHFRIIRDERRIELTKAGKAVLAEAAEAIGGIWKGRIRREEAVTMALSARHLFHRDEDYLVRDGEIQIVDEYTGRLMEDRSWNEGLHQLVEVKEGCEVTGRKVPLARISYQRFFRRYGRLSGMTGTARETARELWAVYRLPVVTIPTNRRLHRKRMLGRIERTADKKWQAITNRTSRLNKLGRPVLIGTRSVAASEAISGYLSEVGLEHVVLNAAQDQDEAEIIARAGESGRVTVATNMAGRGVDIRLDDDVIKQRGLHVILSERHDAGRIDRQLAGRCGRQGEPGTHQAILSLEDPLLDLLPGAILKGLARLPWPIGSIFARLLFRRAQRHSERINSRARRDLVKLDRQLGTLLSFSGDPE